MDGLGSSGPGGFRQHHARLLTGGGVDVVVAEENLRSRSAGSTVLGHVVGTDVDCGGSRLFDHLNGGGLAVGALAWAVPGWASGLRGAGYEVVERCFAFSAGRDIAWSVPLGFLGFFALKMVATSFTVGSGGSGGVFAPALVCGGALGMATGLFFLKVLPMWVGIVPAEFALVGMAGFLASAIRVPIAAVVMVAEISGNHELLMPAMWVCGISFWLNNGWSLYRSQVHSRESSPLH